MSELTPQADKYADCAADMAVLSAMHWKELFGPKGYRADSGAITDMEHAGAFALFTLRDEAGVLAGYVAFTLARSPFFGINIATESGFYLLPEHRGAFAMTKLLRFAAETLTKNGIQRVLLAHANENNIASLVKRAGFTPSGVNYFYEKG